ncbi:hypothetical protein WAI453_006297 [Rhynchosporium graminicola]
MPLRSNALPRPARDGITTVEGSETNIDNLEFSGDYKVLWRTCRKKMRNGQLTLQALWLEFFGTWPINC